MILLSLQGFEIIIKLEDIQGFCKVLKMTIQIRGSISINSIHVSLTRMERCPLHHVNAIRVIAEYFVVRRHVVGGGVGTDMFARELMSFFFVLSGFVMMHKHKDSVLATREDIAKFVAHRWWKVYPTYLVCWSFWIPVMVITAMDLRHQCVWRLYCSLMQPLMLDCWVGCGIRYVNNSPSWYLSCLWWLWLAFAITKDVWRSCFHRNPWWKMTMISLASTGVISVFMEYDIFTVCTIPLLRAGEFVIGCGAACSLSEFSTSQSSNHGRGAVWWFWLPLGFSLGGLVSVYCFLGVDHGLDWLCIHQDTQSFTCGLWRKSPWVDASPPCYTTGDKYFNKNSMAWAVIIYTIAKAEIMGLEDGISTVLGLGIFKWLNQFSLTVYLGHSEIAIAVKWFVCKALGWSEEQQEWPADILIVTVYCVCFFLHHMIHRGWGRIQGISTDDARLLPTGTTEGIPLLLQMQHGMSNHTGRDLDTDSINPSNTDEESGFHGDEGHSGVDTGQME